MLNSTSVTGWAHTSKAANAETRGLRSISNTAIQANLEMNGASPAEVFTELRERKNKGW